MNEMEVDLAKWAVCIKNINPDNHRENCAECAVLTDRMLEGLDFRAASKGCLTTLRTLERLFGSDFEPHLSIQQIEAVLKIAGSGARAIIHGYPDAPQEGHFINAINHRGVIRYFDGQAGGEPDLSWFVDGELAMLRTNF